MRNGSVFDERRIAPKFDRLAMFWHSERVDITACGIGWFSSQRCEIAERGAKNCFRSAPLPQDLKIFRLTARNDTLRAGRFGAPLNIVINHSNNRKGSIISSDWPRLLVLAMD